eukprot:TRINITY_DN3860_c0_g1_i25.p1 TRINITY_DN3860_c0_g1~~TRINITY_DN3860_c0_g1_i25.p1  ORF type:complete len:579 (-),score=52.85 TRINITY_DN3860_c0_g1_i25:867-2603(-)
MTTMTTSTGPSTSTSTRSSTMSYTSTGTRTNFGRSTSISASSTGTCTSTGTRTNFGRSTSISASTSAGVSPSTRSSTNTSTHANVGASTSISTSTITSTSTRTSTSSSTGTSTNASVSPSTSTSTITGASTGTGTSTSARVSPSTSTSTIAGTSTGTGTGTSTSTDTSTSASVSTSTTISTGASASISISTNTSVNVTSVSINVSTSTKPHSPRNSNKLCQTKFNTFGASVSPRNIDAANSASGSRCKRRLSRSPTRSFRTEIEMNLPGSPQGNSSTSFHNRSNRTVGREDVLRGHSARKHSHVPEENATEGREEDLFFPPYSPFSTRILLDHPYQVDPQMEDKRSKVYGEILETEGNYHFGLETLNSVFYTPLVKSNLIGLESINVLFHPSLFESILPLSDKLLEQLKERVTKPYETVDGSSHVFIGSVFVTVAKHLHLYTGYINSFENSTRLLSSLVKSNAQFGSFLRECQKDERCNKHTLEDLLITVVQRVPQYLMLLKDLLKVTPSGHPDNKPTMKALQQVKEAAEFLNSEKKKFESHLRVQHISREWNLEKEFSGKRLIHEGSSICCYFFILR